MGDRFPADVSELRGPLHEWVRIQHKLTANKRRVFSEIRRILRPGGRLVISDITFDGEIPLAIKYNQKLRGECIGGALGYRDLPGLLADLGFADIEVLGLYPYRVVEGFEFFSMTYRALKPATGAGPEFVPPPSLAELRTSAGDAPACSCFLPAGPPPVAPAAQPETGCLVCGAQLVDQSVNEPLACHYCATETPANARCAAGHFVCDTCHRAGALEAIEQVCLSHPEGGAADIMQRIRSHPRFKMHGPEHHAMVPAVILAALRNAGVPVTDEQLRSVVQRGATVPGGACGFLGVCGAAAGVGVAASVLLEATPVQGDKRQQVQNIVVRVLGDIAAVQSAARCCQRDCWIALERASQLFAEELGVRFEVGATPWCEQFGRNQECALGACPLWPRKRE